MQSMSTIRREFIASNLRSHINRLRGILDSIEKEDRVDSAYADESLKGIETGLRRIRRLCLSNN